MVRANAAPPRRDFRRHERLHVRSRTIPSAARSCASVLLREQPNQYSAVHLCRGPARVGACLPSSRSAADVGCSPIAGGPLGCPSLAAGTRRRDLGAATPRAVPHARRPRPLPCRELPPAPRQSDQDLRSGPSSLYRNVSWLRRSLRRPHAVQVSRPRIHDPIRVGHGFPDDARWLDDVAQYPNRVPVASEWRSRPISVGHEPGDRTTILGDDDLLAAFRNLVHQLQTLGFELRRLQGPFP